MKVYFMKQVSWCLVFAMLIIGIAPKAEAGFVPSELIAISEVDTTADLNTIQRAIESEIVAERLKELGFTQDEINDRLLQLSDEQIHQFAQQVDELKVGGDIAGGIIALLVITVLVLVIMELVGVGVVVTR
ncbi:PA2779 family protein [Thermodesulfovibrionales bacterium]|nr:PA2779 family protein [Thermodesulfovibrionales bacterium]MCL0042392.1 PA2779 family protein [Thermodesulfovibrionales bacterium]MCL0051689.1 PA2779 family protein [Thermodesulfovibrionales bacterium]MCL0082988.1 PA2779 family protein [Thermodesulfovibrionales bacterium]